MQLNITDIPAWQGGLCGACTPASGQPAHALQQALQQPLLQAPHLAQLLGVGAQPLLHRVHQGLLGLQHPVALLLDLRQLAAAAGEGEQMKRM